MITVKQKGDLARITNYLIRMAEGEPETILDKYGRAGVDALSAVTPKDSGLTAALWRYEIVKTDNGAKIVFHNDNINQDVNIAIILQYGHGTGTGGWVEGIDYINPALQPIFDSISNDVWKEVSRL